MKVIKNTVFLAITHLAGYVIPLMEIPILARALGPSAYGELLFIQSISLVMSVIVEYGFNLSSSREVAREIDNKKRLGEIFSDVLLAKIILMGCVVLVLTLCIFIFPGFFVRINVDHIFWGVLYFLGFAFSPFWFFLGREKVGGIIFFELILRLISLALLYIVVNDADDVGLALAVMSLTSFTNTFVTNIICLKQLTFIELSFKRAINALRLGLNVFIYRSSNTVLVTAAPALIGALADRTAVGIFVPAEKLIRGVVGLATPVFTAAFPHFSRVLSNGDSRSYGLAWAIVAVTTALGGACAVFLYFFGPALILLAIGTEYTATADLLRWFVWLIPLRIVNQALGLVVLIPTGRERNTSLAMVFFTILSLVLGGVLLHELRALGMVIGLLISEFSLATVLFYIAVQRNFPNTTSSKLP